MEEKLTLDRLLPMAQARAEKLMQAICEKEKMLKKAPAGHLRIAQKGRCTRYFHVTDKSSEWGDYLPDSEKTLIDALAQKDYDMAACTELRRELEVIDRFCKSYHPERVDELYMKLHERRRSHVKPLLLSDEEYARRWQAVTYAGKPFAADAKLLLTARGERVRSKSEVIIADTLLRLKIPYRYEYPRVMQVGGRHVKFYPDFACLRQSDRSEVIWEHFGRMDDPEYIAETLGKFETYTANGIFPGESLIFTMETQERPLNPATVEALAKHFLL